MSKYTVKQLSKLAGVSIRTLHHYDEIGLLKPHSRGMDSGYRYYGQQELLRLQQILFYRELDYPLKEITKVLDDPDFDLIQSLEFHKEALKKRAGRLNILLATIDRTIVKLKSETEMISEDEMYEGFSTEEAIELRQEAIETWGADQVNAVEQRVRKMTKAEWKNIKEEGDAISQRMAALIGQSPEDPEVQNVVLQHFEHLSNFYEVGEERYRGLGQLYVQDERFTAHYDKFGKGLAEFLNKAMQTFCDNGMKAI